MQSILGDGSVQRFTVEDIANTIRLMNRYVLEEPLDEAEIDTILRQETLDKISEGLKQTDKEKLSANDLGDEAIQQLGIITYRSTMYAYQKGVYDEMDKDKLQNFIWDRHLKASNSVVINAMNYVKAIAYKENIPQQRGINVLNGFLDPSREGDEISFTLSPHDSSRITFNQFQARYDPNAESALLERTLETVFDGDKDMVTLFDEVLGDLIKPGRGHGKGFFFYGKSNSGKSEILNMIQAFIGKKYCSSVEISKLSDRFTLDQLAGKVANIDGDVDKFSTTTNGKLKKILTQKDDLTVEKKYCDPHSMEITTRMLFGCNNIPDFSKDPDGMAKRILIIPMNHVFKSTDPGYDPYIGQKLSEPAVLSALLNHALRGYRRLILNKRFTIPERSREEHEELEEQLDNTLYWLRHGLKDSDTAPTEAEMRSVLQAQHISTLFQIYCTFLHDSEMQAMSRAAFSRAICSRFGFKTANKRISRKQGRAFVNKT